MVKIAVFCGFRVVNPDLRQGFPAFPAGPARQDLPSPCVAARRAVPPRRVVPSCHRSCIVNGMKVESPSKTRGVGSARKTDRAKDSSGDFARALDDESADGT